MRVKVRLTTEAVRDIDGVLTFTLEIFGERKHEQYQELIRDALKEIAKDPLNIHSKSRPDVHPFFRTYHLARPGQRARHLFLYRYDGSGVAVVGRLLHDTMELTLHIPRDFDRP